MMPRTERDLQLKPMIFLAAVALSGAAAAQSSDPADAPAAEAKPVAACNAHVFETSIQTVTNGKPHTSKVKLCGEAGQSDADWVVTLKDALAKVDANPKMPPEVKTQIAVALRSEIAKVEGNGTGTGIAVVKVAPPAAAIDLPAPVAAQPAPVAVPVKRPPLPPKPRLSFECYTLGDIGAGGPCTTLTRDTLVTVKTAEELGNGYVLRFVSRNEPRGQVALQPMRKGKSARVRLPAGVCAGGGAGSVELQVVAGGTLLDSGGPFILRC